MSAATDDVDRLEAVADPCPAKDRCGSGAVEWVCIKPAGHAGACTFVNRYPNRPIVHRG